MYRLVALSTAMLIFGAQLVYAQGAPAAAAGPEGGYPITARVTCYAPGAGGKIEGGFETSRPNREGQSIPRTLDDFRLKKSWYVTLAGNQANYQNLYNMGTITYISVLDGRQYTMTNVVGYVHDTGSAFNNSGCAKYGTCEIMMRKFDVAYGDFRSGGNVGLVNGGAFCGNTTQTWKQIDGKIISDSQITAGDYYPAALSGGGTQGLDPNATNGTRFGSNGQIFGSQGAGQGTQGSGMLGNSPSQPAQPISQQILQNTASNPSIPLTPTSTTPLPEVYGTPVLGITAQSRLTASGRVGLVAWSSLNMDAGSCQVVTLAGQTLAQGNGGGQVVPSLTPGIVLRLRCTSRGQTYTAGATVQ